MIFISQNLKFVLPLSIVLLVILIILGLSVRLIRHNQQAVVERLGGYLTTWKSGIHFLIPFIDKVVKKVNISEQTLISNNAFLTLDQKEVSVEFDIIYQPVDSMQYAYGYDKKNSPLASLVSHHLRINIGSHELVSLLPSKDLITESDYQRFDEVSDAWGIKIKRVNIKKILLIKGEGV